MFCLMIVGIYKIYNKEINIKNRVYNYYSDNLVRAKNLELKEILIDEKNYMDLLILFSRYVNKKSIKLLSLHYRELKEKMEEHEGKNILWLMIT